MRNMEGRLARVESKVTGGGNIEAALIAAERAILFRTRLEGGGVWSRCGGHVLAPLNEEVRRLLFFAMLAAQREDVRQRLMKALSHCLTNDPFMLDANYPLLEYVLRLVMHYCTPYPIHPLRIPDGLIQWIEAIRPEEYLHYGPRDWCYECGYRYPGLAHGVCNDPREFLQTRYADDEIAAMAHPFQGKACLLCGGKIVSGGRMCSPSYRPERGNDWDGSPAARLCAAKQAEWSAELEAAQIPASFNHPYLEDAKNIHIWMDKAEEDFVERRKRQKGFIPEQHRALAEKMKHYYLNQ